MPNKIDLAKLYDFLLIAKKLCYSKQNRSQQYKISALIIAKIIEIFLMISNLLECETLPESICLDEPYEFCLIAQHLLKLSSFSLSDGMKKTIEHWKNSIVKFSKTDSLKHMLSNLVDSVFVDSDNGIEKSIFLVFISTISDYKFHDIMSETLENLLLYYQNLDCHRLISQQFYRNLIRISKNCYSKLIMSDYGASKNFVIIFVKNSKIIMKKITEIMSLKDFDSIEHLDPFLDDCRDLLFIWFEWMFDHHTECQDPIIQLIKIDLNSLVEFFIDNRFKNGFAPDVLENFIDKIYDFLLSKCEEPNFNTLIIQSLRAIDSIMEKKFKEIRMNNDFSRFKHLYLEENFEHQILELSRILDECSESSEIKMNLPTWRDVVGNIQLLNANRLRLCLYSKIINLHEFESEEIIEIFLSFYRDFYFLQIISSIISEENSFAQFPQTKESSSIAKIDYEKIKEEFSEYLNKRFKKSLSFFYKKICEKSNSSEFLKNLAAETKSNPNQFCYFILTFDPKISLFSMLKTMNLSDDLLEILEILYSDKEDFILDSLRQLTESITNVEMSCGDENDQNAATIVESFESFSDIDLKNLCEFIIKLAIIFHRYQSDKMSSLRQPLLRTLMKLSTSDILDRMKQFTQFSKINGLNFVLHWILAELLKQSVVLMNDYDISVYKFNLESLKYWANMVYTLPIEEKHLRFQSILIALQVFRAQRKFFLNYKTNFDNKSTEIVDYVNDSSAYHLFNLLWPLFLNLSDSYARKPWLDQFMIEFSNILVIGIDEKCMKDMALFELNQSLLVHNEHSVQERQFRLLKLEKDSLPKSRFLFTKNNYHQYIFDHVVPMLLNEVPSVQFTAYHLIVMAVKSTDWVIESDPKIASKDPIQSDGTNLTVSELTDLNDDLADFW